MAISQSWDWTLKHRIESDHDGSSSEIWNKEGTETISIDCAFALALQIESTESRNINPDGTSRFTCSSEAVILLYYWGRSSNACQTPISSLNRVRALATSTRPELPQPTGLHKPWRCVYIPVAMATVSACATAPLLADKCAIADLNRSIYCSFICMLHAVHYLPDLVQFHQVARRGQPNPVQSNKAMGNVPINSNQLAVINAGD